MATSYFIASDKVGDAKQIFFGRMAIFHHELNLAILIIVYSFAYSMNQWLVNKIIFFAIFLTFCPPMISI